MPTTTPHKFYITTGDYWLCEDCWLELAENFTPRTMPDDLWPDGEYTPTAYPTDRPVCTVCAATP